ncbi:MAG: glycosyltransferase involved in cell wall biosynthesis [Polaribacter sp.]|jgi:glycosyltransferase involved in cell wall biosynthesis
MLYLDNFLITIYLLATLSQLIFWLFIFSRLAFYQPKNQTKKPTNSGHSVSVVVCARNEAENLKKNIPRILNQNYHSFELLVVNDGSTDQTENILLENHMESSNLRRLNVIDKPEGSGKKYALAKGIEASRYEVLLLTDADCEPANNDWIDGMQQYIRGPIEIVLGYAPYLKKPGFLNLFIRYETVYAAIQYLSFALIGQPYMGVGRNLAYKKKLFFEAGGFRSHEHLLSGDDDLFINAAAHTHNTAICIDKQTFMYSEPEENWAAYFRQKSRHLTTGKHYKLTHQAILGTLSFGHILHVLGGFFIIYKFSIIFVMLVYVARMLVVLMIMRPILKKLDEASLWKWIPLLDMVFVIYLLVFAPILLFRKHKQWK